MNREDMQEGFSEWEQIQYSPTTHSIRTDAIAVVEDSSMRPSGHREGSPVHQREQEFPGSPSSSSSSSENALIDDGSVRNYSLPLRLINDLVKKHMNDSRFVLMVKKMFNYAFHGRGFRSFAPATAGLLAALIVSLVYVRVKTNRLVLLIKEKDQKIRQLVLQMERLDELLSSRRRVQVVRIA